jgi:hypothetical protein
MYTRRNIHYVILEKTHTLVKFYQTNSTVIYLKSFLKNHIKNSSGNFYMVKSNDVSFDEFEEYLASLSKYCCVTDRRGNRATLQVNDPF